MQQAKPFMQSPLSVCGRLRLSSSYTRAFAHAPRSYCATGMTQFACAIGATMRAFRNAMESLSALRTDTDGLSEAPVEAR